VIRVLLGGLSPACLICQLAVLCVVRRSSHWIAVHSSSSHNEVVDDDENNNIYNNINTDFRS